MRNNDLVEVLRCELFEHFKELNDPVFDIDICIKMMISDRHCPINRRSVMYEKIRVRKCMVGILFAVELHAYIF